MLNPFGWRRQLWNALGDLLWSHFSGTTASESPTVFSSEFLMQLLTISSCCLVSEFLERQWWSVIWISLMLLSSRFSFSKSHFAPPQTYSKGATSKVKHPIIWTRWAAAVILLVFRTDVSMEALIFGKNAMFWSPSFMYHLKCFVLLAQLSLFRDPIFLRLE